jgi:CBS domain-containing protein
MRRVSVGDVMTRNFVSVQPKDDVYKCAKLMAKEHVNSLIVAENKRLVGMLTARDILWCITKKPGLDLKKIKALDISAKKLAVIKPSAEISQALKKMQTLNFRRLPVLSKGEVIGVVTLKDILSVEPQLYAEMQPLMDEVREHIAKQEKVSTSWPLEGVCDNCGAFSDLLRVEQQLLCQDCREEMF